MTNDVCLGLGSNLGDRLKFLEVALKLLKCEEFDIIKISNVYETVPQNLANQPKYLNCVVFGITELDPFALLNLCQKIECKIGKNKTITFGPRNIDIDILLFNDEEITTERLTIPHYRMMERNFVLTPMKEILPDAKIRGHHIDTLLANCTDQQVVRWTKNCSGII